MCNVSGFMLFLFGKIGPSEVRALPLAAGINFFFFSSKPLLFYQKEGS